MTKVTIIFLHNSSNLERFVDLGQHRRVKEQHKGLTIEVQFDKLADDNDSTDGDEPTPPVQKPVEQQATQQFQQEQQRRTSTQEIQTNFQEMPLLPQLANPVVSQALLQQQIQQQQLPVEAAPVSSWTSPIMTTMPIGQWSSEPPPHNFTQTQPAHWSHQQEQHQPLVDHFVIGSWQQPDQQQQQQQWGGESMQSWSNDAGKIFLQKYLETLIVQ